jgi:hypothetical protein
MTPINPWRGKRGDDFNRKNIFSPNKICSKYFPQISTKFLSIDFFPTINTVPPGYPQLSNFIFNSKMYGLKITEKRIIFISLNSYFDDTN